MMTVQSRCEYDKSYLDLETNNPRQYVCPNNAHENSTFCIFHDPYYLTDTTENEIRQLFLAQVNTAVKNSSSLSCIGYILPQVRINNVKFSKSVYFVDTTFEKGAHFENIIFNSIVQFSESTFKNGVRFNQTCFLNKVDFANVKIRGSTSTFHSTFSGETTFENSEIHNAIFDSSFTKPVTFENAQMTNTKFSLSVFDEVNFSEAGFYDSVEFYGSKFGNGIFTKAHIHNARFSTSVFDKVNFSEAEFIGSTDFKETEFKDKANFRKCMIKNIITFEHSTFKSVVSFEGSIFSNYANFRNVQFHEQEKVIFTGNLSNISFLHTNITRIRFANDVTWSEDEDCPYHVFEERVLINNKEDDLRLEDVMDLYRHLRDNCEFYSRYELSGQFYIRELELRRKYKQNVTGQNPKTIQKDVMYQIFSILAVFYAISKYGQSLARPLYFAGMVIAFSTIYFWTSGFTNPGNVLIIGSLSKSFTYSLLRSASAFFPFLTFDGHHATSDFLLRIGLLPITGTFILALKRNLERKLRY